MLEELQTQPSQEPAPDQDTQLNGEAESVSQEDGPEGQSSSENAHPSEDGGTEIFHSEGGKTFKTKEDYIQHVNKWRGAAANVIGNNKQMAARIAELESALASKETKTQDENALDELDPEQRAALSTLKKAGGFISVDEVEAILAKRLGKYEPIISRVEREQMAQAQKSVESFIEANPDAADVDVHKDMIDMLEKMDKAGIPGGIQNAYFLVTGRQPNKTPAAKVDAQTRSIKKAQASSSNATGGSSSAVVKKEGDIFSALFN